MRDDRHPRSEEISPDRGPDAGLHLRFIDGPDLAARIARVDLTCPRRQQEVVVPTRLFEPEPRTQAPPRPFRESCVSSPTLVERVLETEPATFLSVCRLLLGGVMFAHAAQKLLGWFGGAGLTATVESFRDTLGLPLIVGTLVVFAEFAGAVGLILGFLGRVAAACIVTVMVGAILLVHLPHGFFMNWFGTAAGEGFEYHLLAIGLAIPILARGSGAVSLDLWLCRQARKDRTAAA
jgi:putative oxidoreductase